MSTKGSLNKLFQMGPWEIPGGVGSPINSQTLKTQYKHKSRPQKSWEIKITHSLILVMTSLFFCLFKLNFSAILNYLRHTVYPISTKLHPRIVI